MKQADALQWRPAGTLPRPGWIGRLVRLGLAGLCLYVLSELIRYWSVVLLHPDQAMRGFVLPILGMLWVFNYVVNIGFGVSWRRWPLFALLAAFAAACVVSRLLYGDWFAEPGGALLLAALGYFYAHLGVSFLLAAAFATPGCEMRALPHLIATFGDRDPAEHPCPAGFLHRLDQWEATRRS